MTLLSSESRIGRIVSWLIIPLSVVADQLSKSWIVERYYLWEVDPLIGEIVRITRVHNTGAAFGIAQGYPEIFKGLTLIAIAVLFIHKLVTSNTTTAYHIALGLVLSGALGNLIDRFHYNYVVDFIDIGLLDWRWPAFNVADSAITIGVTVLLLLSFFESRSGAPADNAQVKTVCSL